MDPSQLALRLDSVVKRYDRKVAVDRVSLEVRRGEIVGFLGPNGAGKTTTIRMIMGITAPDEGKITYHLEGVPTDRIPKDRVGYLPEERGLYKQARILDVLLFLGSLKGLSMAEAQARALDQLTRFGLGEYAYAKVDQLSKGMAQKVQFIAAILHDPTFVVLDEPFSGLDPVNQDLFMHEIRRLADSGCAILLSSHQMNLVEALCDRIFLINQGRRVLYGPLHSVKAEYGLHRATLHLSDPAWQMPPSPLIDSISASGNQIVCLLKPGVAPAQFLRSLPAEAPIEELSISRISLHEIFVRVAQGREAS